MYIPNVLVKVDVITIRPNETLTLYCQSLWEDDNRKQIEIRVTQEGVVEIFHHEDESLVIKTFDAWYDSDKPACRRKDKDEHRRKM